SFRARKAEFSSAAQWSCAPSVVTPGPRPWGRRWDLLAERVLRRVDAERALRCWGDDGCPLTVQVSQPARPSEDEMRFRHSKGVSRSGDVVEDESSRSTASATCASGIPLEALGSVGMR